MVLPPPDYLSAAVPATFSRPSVAGYLPTIAITVFDASTAPMAVTTAPCMTLTNYDCEGMHHGTQPGDYNAGECPHKRDARPFPKTLTTRRRWAPGANRINPLNILPQTLTV